MKGKKCPVDVEWALDGKDNKLYIQAGAGIVYDSVPKNEHQEILNKAGALMAAAEDSYKFDS